MMSMWNELTLEQQLSELITASQNKPQVIFKHSTRCGTSSLAKNRLERQYSNDFADFHLLDLLRYRELSTKIADTFSVYHESPQVLLIKNGECIYDESHLSINMDELAEQASS